MREVEVISLDTNDLTRDGGSELAASFRPEDDVFAAHSEIDRQDNREAIDAQHHTSNRRTTQQFYALPPVQLYDPKTRFMFRRHDHAPSCAPDVHVKQGLKTHWDRIPVQLTERASRPTVTCVHDPEGCFAMNEVSGWRHGIDALKRAGRPLPTVQLRPRS
jgi:hypothetical protein